MKIKLVTTNAIKKEEFISFFKNYGISISEENPDYELKEETKIFDYSLGHEILPSDIYKVKNFTKVYTYSTLFVKDKNNKTTIFTSSKIEGYILQNKKVKDELVFGWDDIFFIPSCGLTIHEIKKINTKVSGRQENLSCFIKNHGHYEKRLNLNFNEIPTNETIVLDHSVFNFINENKYINAVPEIKNLILKATKNGAFFRSSKTRREKNYWFPGLNAGIPLIAKKDDIHEITFAVHDFFHFLIPDLIFDGKDSRKTKQIYIISRMMSEAISLVLADGLFIQGLKESNIDYDFSKRKIYPLFEKINLFDQEKLKSVIFSMVNYVLKGEDSYLREITNDENAIAVFKNKYDSFFVEDYKWTFINYENMNHRKDLFLAWNEMLNSSEFLKTTNFIFQDEEEFIPVIFNKFMELIFEKETISKEKAFSLSFKRYMLGNMFLFEQFNEISISKNYKNVILNALQEDIDLELAKRIQIFYQEYVSKLLEMKVIDDDQCLLYKEIYPLFDPSFAFYDKEKSFYLKSIKDFYNQLKGV